MTAESTIEPSAKFNGSMRMALQRAGELCAARKYAEVRCRKKSGGRGRIRIADGDFYFSHDSVSRYTHVFFFFFIRTTYIIIPLCENRRSFLRDINPRDGRIGNLERRSTDFSRRPFDECPRVAFFFLQRVARMQWSVREMRDLSRTILRSAKWAKFRCGNVLGECIL